MATVIRSVKGKRVAVTGLLWTTRSEVFRILRASGAHPIEHEKIPGDTDILVRGTSRNWKFSRFGRKEAAAAKLIRSGKPLEAISGEGLRRLLTEHSQARTLEWVAGERVEDLRGQTGIKALVKEFGTLDVLRNIKTRQEQQYLRYVLFRDSTEATCSLCGRQLPTTLLVAAHIKRRSECTTKQKRDLMNIAMPLCLLGCDALYERGLVTVDDKGRIRTLSKAGFIPALRPIAEKLSKRLCGSFRAATAPYFQWHRENVFLGT